jgi:hypothetical protein
MKTCATVFLLSVCLSVNAYGQSRKRATTVIVKLGMTANSRQSKEWQNALVSRMSKGELDSMAALRRPLTADELGWKKLFESKAALWNSFRENLRAPFGNGDVPDTVYVLLGAFGSDDAFTYQYNTICFDVTAYQTAYGAATLPGNSEKMDRIFAHEFTHLLHKDWARRNKLVLKTFKDSIIWECLYEGIGMYGSLQPKWLPKDGIIPAETKAVLEELYPQFVSNLIKVEAYKSLSAADKSKIEAHLSRGQVQKKWGAFTVAIWLALEAGGDDKKLARWINGGLSSIPALANKYLTGDDKSRFKIAYPEKY